MNLKVREICRDCSLDYLLTKRQRTKFFFSFTRGTSTLWNTIHGIFCKNSQRLNTATMFSKSSILDVLLGSEYVCEYLEVFPIIMNWGCHFASFKNLSNLMNILFKYLEQKFSLWCNKVMFETCQKFTLRNKNGF